MGASHHALRGPLGRQARTDRKAAAERLGDRHDVGRNPFPFVCKQLAGAAHPCLHLVIDEEQIELVGNLAQSFEIARRRGAHPALTLDRLDKDRRRLLADRGAHLVQIAKGDVVEALHRRSEAFEIGLVPCRREGRQGTAVERALAANDAIALGMTGLGLVFARDLDCQLARLGPGIAEEHGVGESVVDQTLRQPLLARDLEQVRGVPQALGLLGDGADQMRVAVPEPGHRDAAGEIEKLAPVGGPEIGALAPLDGDIPPAVGGHNS